MKYRDHCTAKTVPLYKEWNDSHYPKSVVVYCHRDPRCQWHYADALTQRAPWQTVMPMTLVTHDVTWSIARETSFCCSPLHWTVPTKFLYSLHSKSSMVTDWPKIVEIWRYRRSEDIHFNCTINYCPGTVIADTRRINRHYCDSLSGINLSYVYRWFKKSIENICCVPFIDIHNLL